MHTLQLPPQPALDLSTSEMIRIADAEQKDSPPQCAKCARLADAQRKLKKHQALLDRLNLGVLPRIMQEAAE